MKKLVSLLLAALLVCTMLPAMAEGIGSPGNPVQVKYLCKDVSLEEEAVVMMEKLIEEKMAEQGDYVDLVILESPAGTYGEAVPLAFRTGQLDVDLLYFQGGDEAIANEGLLENWLPYIENSTYLGEIMEEYNVERVTNYPYLLWISPATLYIPMMREDHLQAIGMLETLRNDPTVDNYYQAFKALVDEGIVKYAVSGDGGLTRLDHVFNHAFGVTSTIMKNDEGKWVYSVATEYTKEKLAFYAKLYAEGLIDPEYLTSKWSDVAQKFYAGELAMVAVTQGGVVDSYATKIELNQGEAAKAVVLPPAKGVSQKYYSVSVAKETRGWAISADSEVKEAAVAIMDFMASPEGRIIDKLGIEGIHYTIEGGTVTLTESYSDWWSKFWETFNNLDESFVDKNILMTEQAWQSMDMAKEYYAEDIDVVLPADYLPSYDAVMELYNQYATDIILGQRPVDDFDEFISLYGGYGGDALAEYLATVLD